MLLASARMLVASATMCNSCRYYVRVFIDIHRTSFAWLIFLVAHASIVAHASLVGHAQEKTLPIIDPGTIVGNEDATKWNRVILLATPRIASGDTTKLSEAVRTAVSKLTLTILATVKGEAAGDGKKSYRLDEVGVGYSTTINEKLITISTDSAARLGARLDFYNRQMLSENEKQIANLKLVVRTPTLAIFDAPAIMFREGQHKDFVTRHLIWIDSKTGKLALIIWLLSTDGDGKHSTAEETLRVVAPGTSEDRKIHVDGRSFFLGIPTARSFALENLPPGPDIDWSEPAKEIASRLAYYTSELNELAAALNQMLQGK